MKLANIPFETTDWAEAAASEHRGVSGVATWRTLQHGDLRIRVVEYTPGYIADHWCAKGHVLYCLEGELLTELKDGRAFVLKTGMSYQVADDETPHRSSTILGARVFIVD
jgi:quercetin dioxygenase-like cupin family protein